jgi:hypothetical protein
MPARRTGPWKKRSRLFVAFERLVLGAGMTVMAFFIERRLLKAIKKGSVEPAARTAGEPEPSEPGQGHLTTTPQQVGDQADR